MKPPRWLRWLFPRDAKPEAEAAAREAEQARQSAARAAQRMEATKEMDPEVSTLAEKVRQLADRDVFAQMLAATFKDRR